MSNDYQMDGAPMNHPGLGGDLLALSIDWIEALDVRGPGVGAEQGNFQGGVINAVTKTGGNDRQYALRTNYESSRLTSTNLNANEEGVEQAGRRELSGPTSNMSRCSSRTRERAYLTIRSACSSHSTRRKQTAGSWPSDRAFDRGGAWRPTMGRK